MCQKIKYSFCLLILIIASVHTAYSQENYNGFDPQQFEIKLQQYIVQKVHLTPQESAKFFPLYSEMRAQQRVIFNKDRQNRHINPNDEKACERALKNHDANEIQLKKIQQQYHLKFLKILPASKVYQIVQAESSFHRKAFKRAIKPRKR